MHVEKRKKIKSRYGKIVPDIRCPVTPCGYYVPAKESEIRLRNPNPGFGGTDGVHLTITRY